MGLHCFGYVVEWFGTPIARPRSATSFVKWIHRSQLCQAEIVNLSTRLLWRKNRTFWEEENTRQKDQVSGCQVVLKPSHLSVVPEQRQPNGCAQMSKGHIAEADQTTPNSSGARRTDHPAIDTQTIAFCHFTASKARQQSRRRLQGRIRLAKGPKEPVPGLLPIPARLRKAQECGNVKLDVKVIGVEGGYRGEAFV